MRAVLDTNVLAAGFVHPDPPPGQLLQAWRESRYELIASQHILVELARTFQQPYFSRHFTPAQQTNNLMLLATHAIITLITFEVTGVATHPEDDMIPAAAVSAAADYLVTGDAKLQSLGGYRGVTILSPRSFLKVLDSAA